MRSLRYLSALSFGLASIALSSAALAESPRVITRSGRFPVASLASGKVATSAALEKAARQLVNEQIPTSSQAELGVAATTVLASGDRVVKIPQIYRGLPVAHRGVAVTFGADDVAQIVSSALESNLPGEVVPQITAGEAALSAATISKFDMDPARAILAIWPTADGGKLVWALDTPLLAPLPYQPVVIVDAITGEVILRYNAVTDLNAAKVYPTNPTKSPALIDVTLPVGMGKTTLENNLVQSENCIDTHMAKPISIMGFNITLHVCALIQTAKPDMNGDYLIPPGMDTDPEEPFSELSMFYHVNRAYDFFRGWNPNLLVNGADPIPTVSNLRLPQGFDTLDLQKLGDPNLPFVPFQNAFFSPADPLFGAIFGINGGAMFFGQGPNRDYSYDGDVIYHEFTHSVVNVTLKLVGTPHLDEYGVSYSPGAMNEGLADFFSSALAGDPDVGEYASKDFAPNLTAIRSLTAPDACPSAIGGEVHQDATMFSASLWDVRSKLTVAQQAEFDAAVFKAMNSSPTGDVAYEDVGKLILSAIEASPLGKTVADAQTTAFTNRGLWPKCTRIIESMGQKLNGPKDLQGLWWAPGTQTTGATSQNGKWTPGIVQFHQKLAANTAKITVTFTSVDVGSGGGLGMGGTPFTPKLMVRFGADPLKFLYGPLRTNDDVLISDPSASGKSYTGTVDVPAGATEAYVMIGSTGGSDGAYTALTISEEPGAVSSGSGGGSSSSSAESSSSSAGGNPPPEEVGGCGCTVPGEGSSGAATAAIALVAAGIFASRRRRRG